MSKWKEQPYAWLEGLNIINTATLFKFKYKYNMIQNPEIFKLIRFRKNTNDQKLFCCIANIHQTLVASNNNYLFYIHGCTDWLWFGCPRLALTISQGSHPGYLNSI